MRRAALLAVVVVVYWALRLWLQGQDAVDRLLSGQAGLGLAAALVGLLVLRLLLLVVAPGLVIAAVVRAIIGAVGRRGP